MIHTIRRPRLAMRGKAVGIAIGVNRAIAALDNEGGALLIDRQESHDAAAALESVFQDARVIGAARRHGVRIALLPPLADDRFITLSALNTPQAERALKFRAARHFSRTVENPVISAAQPPGCGRDIFLGSMASGIEIGRIHSVLAVAHVRCLGVHSACAAWLNNGGADAPRALMHDEVLIAAVRIHDRLTALRRVPLWSSTIPHVLAEAGLAPTAIDDGNVPDAGAFAAHLMITSGGRELRTDQILEARSRRAQHRTSAMLALAATMAIAGQFIGYATQGRALERLHLLRQENAEMAQAELNQRRRLDAMAAAAVELTGAEQAASVPHLLVQLLPHVPPGTELDVLEIGSEGVVLSGGAPAADRVFAQLVAAPQTSRVEWIGPVRRSMEGGATTEFFGVTATLSRAP